MGALRALALAPVTEDHPSEDVVRSPWAIGGDVDTIGAKAVGSWQDAASRPRASWPSSTSGAECEERLEGATTRVRSAA